MEKELELEGFKYDWKKDGDSPRYSSMERVVCGG